MTSTAGVRKILRGSAWFLGARVASDVARVARVLLVAAFAGPATLGTVAAALFVTSCAETLTEPGFAASVVQAGERRMATLGAMTSAQLVRGFVIGLAVWACAPALESWFVVPELAWTLRAFVVLLILKAASNPAAPLLGRDGRYSTLAILNAADPALSIVVLLVLLRVSAPLHALVVALIAGQTARTVLSYVLTPVRPWPTLAFGPLRQHFRFGRWILAAQVVVFLSLQGDNAVVAKLLGAAALGVYQVAFRIAELPALLSSAIVGQAAFPAFSAASGEQRVLHREFFVLQRLLVGANALLCVLIWVFGRLIVRSLFGPQWIGAADLLPILLAASFLRATLNMGGWLFLAAGAPQFNFAMNAVRLGAFAIAVVPLARQAGLAGVAAAVAFGSLCALPVYGFGLRRTISGTWREHFRVTRAAYETVAS